MSPAGRGVTSTLSRSREKEVTLEVVVSHKEELLSMLEIEEKSFQAKKEGMERNLNGAIGFKPFDWTMKQSLT